MAIIESEASSQLVVQVGEETSSLSTVQPRRDTGSQVAFQPRLSKLYETACDEFRIGGHLEM